MGCGVWGLGFGVWGLGVGVWGLGVGCWGLGVESGRVWGEHHEVLVHPGRLRFPVRQVHVGDVLLGLDRLAPERIY